MGFTLDWAVRRLVRPRDRLRTEGPPVPVTPASPHAVVIGAGFGGLAAAIRLGARGYRVSVVDRLDQPGGRARVFRQDGFVFDAGPTVITAPFLLEELWELAGATLADDVELREIDPFYRLRFHDGEVFDYCRSPERMRAQIRSLCPEDVEGYERFLAHSERIYKVGFSKLGHVPFDSPFEMARVAPVMVLLESMRSVWQLVSKYVKNDKLRQVLSFHTLLVGGNPFSTSSIYALVAFLERDMSVWYAMGGTGAIVRGMVRLIERLGGRVRLGQEVDQIVVANGKASGVRLASRETLAADVVVSNADAVFTYRHLLSEYPPAKWSQSRVERVRYSMGLFVWYFGTDRIYEDLAHHTILLGPRYEALLRDIFSRKVLAEDFSLYLHRPTATDPSMAPPGHDAFYVLSPVPHLDADVCWKTEAEAYRRKISRYLEDSIMPELSSHIVTSRLLTPREFRTDYRSVKGAAFGPEPVLHQSAYFRPHNRSPLRGLYLVGAGTHPGAGIPGVLSSARILDTVVPDAAHHRVRGAR